MPTSCWSADRFIILPPNLCMDFISAVFVVRVYPMRRGKANQPDPMEKKRAQETATRWKEARKTDERSKRVQRVSQA